MSGGAVGGGIIGDGPMIEEVNGQKNLLSTDAQLAFDAIYAEYQDDEDSLTEAQILFVLDCGKEIVRVLNE